MCVQAPSTPLECQHVANLREQQLPLVQHRLHAQIRDHFLHLGLLLRRELLQHRSQQGILRLRRDTLGRFLDTAH